MRTIGLYLVKTLLIFLIAIKIPMGMNVVYQQSSIASASTAVHLLSPTQKTTQNTDQFRISRRNDQVQIFVVSLAKRFTPSSFTSIVLCEKYLPLVIHNPSFTTLKSPPLHRPPIQA